MNYGRIAGCRGRLISPLVGTADQFRRYSQIVVTIRLPTTYSRTRRTASTNVKDLVLEVGPMRREYNGLWAVILCSLNW